jgi:P pilus assembly chaperone PapD
MKKIILSLSFCLLCISSTLYAQVTISPTNLFIKQEAPFGTYVVINGSNEAQEIGIEFIFGYSDTDETGKRSLVYDDSTKEELHSIKECIRAFPRNFTLQPGQRQIVRLRVTAPNDLEDGTYWARIRTTSKPETPPLELQSNDNVTARVGFEIQQVTGVYLKKGAVSTGIEINNIRTVRNGDKLEVLTNYSRLGNSPFLGSIDANIYDSNGKKLEASNFVSTTLFFDGTHRQEIDISNLASGNYSVEMVFRTQRNDISPEDLVKATTTTGKTTFSIQ